MSMKIFYNKVINPPFTETVPHIIIPGIGMKKLEIIDGFDVIELSLKEMQELKKEIERQLELHY